MPKYTADFQKVLEFARTEARTLNSEFIGTEHLLLGIADLQEEADGAVLPFVDARRQILKEAEKLIHPSASPTVTLNDLPFSPRVKRVLHFAGEVAKERGRTEICSTALLIGLLQEREGIAHQILGPLVGDLRVFEGKLFASMGGVPKEKSPLVMPELSDTLPDIRKALEKFYNNPERKCSACGRKQNIRPTELRHWSGEWVVTSWKIDDAFGWAGVRVAGEGEGLGEKKLFCPKCAEERLGREREKNR